MAQYYIITGNEKTGPFDIITMIKKIKNGTVKRDTQIIEGESAPRSAADIDELSEIVLEAEGKETSVTPTFRNINTSLDLKRSLTIGWRFLIENQMSVAYAGVLLAAMLVLGFVLSYIPFLGYIAVFAAGYVLYSAYFVYVLRTYRGQHIDLAYVIKKVSRNLHSLVMAGLIATIVISASISLSVSISYYFLLLTIPGLFVWMGLIFAPLLITEGDLNFATAISLSRERVKTLPMDSIGVLFGLVVINYAAAICFVAPLIFTLPITVGAIVEIYEELFSH